MSRSWCAGAGMAWPAHRKTNADSGTCTTEEELSLQEDLTIGDGENLYDVR